MDALAVKVARRFMAEVLTKSWLMGVRRGWLSVLHVKPHDWEGILKAIDRLREFVDNLEDQVFYVRRGPHTSVPSMSEGEDVRAKFKKVREAISEQKSRARHWMEVERDPNFLGRATFPVEQGIHMRKLYEEKFPELMTTYVPTRGGYNKQREANITELLDDVLELLRKDAKRLEDEMKRDEAQGKSDTRETWGEPEYTDFDLYGVKVIIDDKSVRPGQIREYVRFLDATHAAMKSKGFGKMWYGRIFIQCEKCGGENPYGAQFGVGGDYSIGKDDIRLYSRPSSGLVRLLAHELAHRYWYKHMSGSQRARFIAWIESGEVSSVTDYGSKSPDEAFAEVVSFFVVGRDMTRDQLESFRAVLASSAGPKPEVLLMAPLRREPCADTYTYSRSQPSSSRFPATRR